MTKMTKILPMRSFEVPVTVAVSGSCPPPMVRTAASVGATRTVVAGAWHYLVDRRVWGRIYGDMADFEYLRLGFVAMKRFILFLLENKVLLPV